MIKSERIFLDLFEDAYGSPTELADVLDLGLEMLFYVEEGAFTQREIQNAATALRKISRVSKGCN
ncbi:hypothetical protein V1387_06285 [Allomuricauda taeanensis]|uniref:hypothetical protein n=1 Tax=Flagellimonas taeanensis TaxID=1005926 RepID=UPI002E7B2937|nr:hypothetical protein [Allomuricauda taeanensis]MEE1962284.1 hypothetical protein [Allomuricauda taeanensis]